MGFFQLGCPVPYLHKHTASFWNKPSFQHSTERGCFCRHVHRCHIVNDFEHLPGEDRDLERKILLHSRRSTLLQLHCKRSDAHRTFLVWLDIVSSHSLDRTNNRCGLRHDGHLLDLSGGLQLSCRHLPSVCKFRIGSAVILQEHARGCISLDCSPDVHSHDYPRRVFVSWRCRSRVDYRTLDPALLWTKDSSQEQVRQ